MIACISKNLRLHTEVGIFYFSRLSVVIFEKSEEYFYFLQID